MEGGGERKRKRFVGEAAAGGEVRKKTITKAATVCVSLALSVCPCLFLSLRNEFREMEILELETKQIRTILHNSLFLDFFSFFEKYLYFFF